MNVTKERKRYDGTVAKEAVALVGDASGSANLLLRDAQVDQVKGGEVITIRNANANVKDEHLRLEVDRWAKLEQSTVKVDTVNTSNNVSDIEYERVYPTSNNNRRGNRY